MTCLALASGVMCSSSEPRRSVWGAIRRASFGVLTNRAESRRPAVVLEPIAIGFKWQRYRGRMPRATVQPTVAVYKRRRDCPMGGWATQSASVPRCATSTSSRAVPYESFSSLDRADRRPSAAKRGRILGCIAAASSLGLVGSSSLHILERLPRGVLPLDPPVGAAA